MYSSKSQTQNISSHSYYASLVASVFHFLGWLFPISLLSQHIPLASSPFPAIVILDWEWRSQQGWESLILPPGDEHLILPFSQRGGTARPLSLPQAGWPPGSPFPSLCLPETPPLSLLVGSFYWGESALSSRINYQMVLLNISFCYSCWQAEILI